MTVATTRRQRPCRAQDPSKCLYHGKVTPESLYQSFVKDREAKKKPATATPRTAAQIVDRATQTPLGWQGPTPTWWDAYKTQTAIAPQIPSTVELIDVISSPAGKLAVVWQEESNDAVDRAVTLDSGIAVHIMAYKSFATGETLGYVKQQFLTDNTFKRSFGDDEFTTFRWHERFSGNNLNLKDWDQRRGGDRGPSYTNLTGDALINKRREVWAGVAKLYLFGAVKIDGKHVPTYNITAAHAPDDAQVQKDLRKAAMKLQPGIQEHKDHYAVPFVDYSEVEEPLQGKGFGAALYIYTARQLARRGQVLRASGLQSTEAESVWANFNKHMPQHTKEITLTYHGQPNTNQTLDFRHA